MKNYLLKAQFIIGLSCLVIELRVRATSRERELSMLNSKMFNLLTKCAGLSPYALNGADDVKLKRHRRMLNDALVLLPSICVAIVFSFSLLSIFWHTGNRSETSNITNWIQVRTELASVTCSSFCFSSFRMPSRLISSC